MHYKISAPNPASQLFEIEINIKKIDSPSLYLQLPSWRPGRYELGNFAKNILYFNVKSTKGEQVSFKKVRKDCWEIETNGSNELIITYQYYANQLDGGSTYLDHRQWYINFINCLMYVEGRLDSPCSVQLECLKSYKVACGLEKKEPHLLVASNYYQLVDSPLIASPLLEKYEYQIGDYRFYLWFLGDHLPDKEKTIASFKAFSQKQITCMGELPCQEYHFLYQLLPNKAYHGVEHFNSTIVVLGPSEKINEQELWESFLGVSSHELFHVWNIIRIRPAEMWPYDFTKENYFKTGYVAEGFTTYYGDLFLKRSQCFDAKWYLNEMNKSLKRHFENYGRFNLSLADSSYDLWLDGYSAGIPNRKVSIYIKGAIVSLMLDMRIRIDSGHKNSLDDVMRRLYQDYYKKEKGYHERDIIELASEAAGKDLAQFFDLYIYGTEAVEHELSEMVGHFGLRLQLKQSSNSLERHLGIRIDDQSKISKIIPQSEAYFKMQIDDELVAVNGRKIAGNIHELIRNESKIKLDFIRQHRMMQLELSKSETPYFQYYELVVDESADKTQIANRENWWG